MKNKMFKMSLILLFSIFSNVKSEYESGFDEFNQPVDSKGFIDQNKYMNNFVEVKDYGNTSEKNPYYIKYYNYLKHPVIYNNPNLNEELLENFNAWGDWDKAYEPTEYEPTSFLSNPLVGPESKETKFNRNQWIKNNNRTINESLYQRSLNSFKADKNIRQFNETNNDEKNINLKTQDKWPYYQDNDPYFHLKNKNDFYRYNNAISNGLGFSENNMKDDNHNSNGIKKYSHGLYMDHDKDYIK